jgi:hypothetical protein
MAPSRTGCPNVYRLARYLSADETIKLRLINTIVIEQSFGDSLYRWPVFLEQSLCLPLKSIEQFAKGNFVDQNLALT